MVHLRDILDSEEFATAESKLSMGLGKDVSRSKSYCRYCKNASFTCSSEVQAQERVYV